MNDLLKEKIKADLKVAEAAKGITLKEIIAANRKFLKKREEDKINVGNETGLKISAIGNGKVYIKLNSSDYSEIKEGYSMTIPDEIHTVTRSDIYTIDDEGNIECIENNINGYHKPKPKKSDIDRINAHKELLIESAKKYKGNEYARIDLPDTDLSVLIESHNIKLVHNLKTDSKGDFPLDDGADLWINILGHLDSMSVVTGEEVVEDMSELLDGINVPEDQVPEYLKQNMGEKISVFPKKDRKNAKKEYKIIDYSKTKERLANIIKVVKGTREKGENEVLKDGGKEPRDYN